MEAVAQRDDGGAVRAVVRGKSHQIKHCFERSRRGNPNLMGRLVASVVVTDGEVVAVGIDDSTGDATLGRCVARTMMRWQFPDEVSRTLSLPFVFTG